MASLNNPAGRLYEYLAAFRNSADDRTTIRETWATVLGQPDNGPELFQQLGRVADLLPQIEVATREISSENHRKAVAHYTRTWAGALFPHAAGYGQNPSNGTKLLSNEAMLALGSLADHLAVVEPEGRDMPKGERDDFSARVESLVSEIRKDDQLDEQLRLLIVRRLRGIQSALDNYRITGPKGIQQACKLLGAEIVLDERLNNGEKRFPAKVLQLITAIYEAATVATTVYGAVDVGLNLTQLLP